LASFPGGYRWTGKFPWRLSVDWQVSLDFNCGWTSDFYDLSPCYQVPNTGSMTQATSQAFPNTLQILNHLKTEYLYKISNELKVRISFSSPSHTHNSKCWDVKHSMQ
jgi:hypothetical protein